MFCAFRYGVLSLVVPLALIGQIANACTPPERPFLPERSQDIREYADLLRSDFEGYIAEALLHKSGPDRRSPFPGRIYPTASVIGIPSAV
jgi:hypothetical protein